MTLDHWIHIDGKPQRATLLEWAEFFKDFEKNRRVAETEVAGVRISTIFLGLDHGFGRTNTPQLWETMVFGDAPGLDMDMDMDRCGGHRDQAEEMHNRMVTAVKSALGIVGG